MRATFYPDNQLSLLTNWLVCPYIESKNARFKPGPKNRAQGKHSNLEILTLNPKP